jgi:hypothetical protein
VTVPTGMDCRRYRPGAVLVPALVMLTPESRAEPPAGAAGDDDPRPPWAAEPPGLQAETPRATAPKTSPLISNLVVFKAKSLLCGRDKPSIRGTGSYQLRFTSQDLG